ncbi:EAL domain-containing protein [Paenibacillus sp. YYML68]|uniref:EAL domain-containing protein n=1 Tax=Paenibacillus sp. YYML68 TaxID=2909250 RepID=UPI0024917EEA|nr:EAL domain-containing protein [Paenibacillus sp. YYML68]
MAKRTIGILTPLIEGFYFNGMLQGIYQAAAELRTDLIVFRTCHNNNEIEYNRYLAFDRIDGWIIILNAVQEPAYKKHIEQTGKPVICTPDDLGIQSAVTYTVSNEQGGYEATLHMLAHGHRDIAFVYSTSNEESVLRYQGYLRALEEHGIPINPNLIYQTPNLWEKHGEALASQMKERGLCFTACIVSSDMMAIGILQSFNTFGIRVPEDVALFSFDNTEYAKRFSLSSVAQPLFSRGQCMLQHLVSQIEHPEPPSTYTIVQPIQLVTRRSCGCQPEEPSPDMETLYHENLKVVEYLTDIVRRNQNIGHNLIQVNNDTLRSLDWLTYTTYTWGCVALWTRDGRLVVDNVYSTKPHPMLVIGDVYEELAFPPPMLHELLQDGEMMTIQSLKTANRDIGFLVLIGDFFDVQLTRSLGPFVHSITHPINLLAYALEREMLHEEARERENRLEIVSNTTNDGIFDWDLTTGRMVWNKQIHHILQREELEMGADEFIERVHPDDVPALCDALQNHYEHGAPFQIEFRMLKNETEQIWIQAAGEAIKDSHDTPFRMIGSIVDITARKRAEEQIHRMAYTDTLTQLANRRFIYERIAELTMKEERAALIMLDLDRFKVINDSMGHLVGDELLRQVASLLQTAAGPSEIVARLGGDEFIIVCTRLDNAQHPEQLATRILRALNAPQEINGHTVYATPSMGICFYPEHGNNREQLIQNADLAMYQAKEAGKNRYRIYHPSMSLNSMQKLTMESCLHGALEAKQFELHYQPQIDMHTNAIVGIEALIRWVSPVFGRVSPLDFIPLAEETRLIIPISEWIVRRACEDTKLLLEQGFGALKISVNISALHLAEPHFADSISTIVQQTGLAPEQLCLEITERIAVQQWSTSAEQLNALRQLGIRIALDDFGIGNSSLSFVKTLPLDMIKIDQMFVRDISHNEISRAIFTTIQNLIDDLKLDSCVEGIETDEQLEFAKKQRCHMAQGYYISRPMPYAELVEFLRGRG